MCVFVSYRREDSPYVAGRFKESLMRIYGRHQVFFDTDSIEPGEDFRTVISARMARADVVFALIGPDWRPDRLDSPTDYVRVELEQAMLLQKRVVPVVIDPAPLPDAADLPAGLAPLVYLNAARLRPDPDFEPDVHRLVEALAPMGGRRLRRAANTRLLVGVLLGALMVGTIATLIVRSNQSDSDGKATPTIPRTSATEPATSTSSSTAALPSSTTVAFEPTTAATPQQGEKVVSASASVLLDDRPKIARPVVALDLSSGRWVVYAIATVRYEGPPSVLTTCSLVTDGAVSLDSTTVNVGSHAPPTGQVVLMGVAKNATPATVRMTCEFAYTEPLDPPVAVDAGARIQALPVSEADGRVATETFGGLPGPKKAAAVIELALDPGRWAVAAKMAGYNTGDSQLVSCDLIAPTSVRSDQVQVGKLIGSPEQATMLITMMVDLTTPATLTVSCAYPGPSRGPYIDANARIVAWRPTDKTSLPTDNAAPPRKYSLTLG